MPRLPVSLLHRAHAHNPLLIPLLRACRDLQSAKNELRWLKDHVTSIAKKCPDKSTQKSKRRYLLRDFCQKRGRGVPLQYIIGNQPFGELEILCRSGVLIPRSETEAWTTYTAGVIANIVQPIQARPGKNCEPLPLRILDLCTGTGCIALHLHSLLHKSFPALETVAVELSHIALNLAWSNLCHNVRIGCLHPSAARQIQFLQADLLGRSLRLPEFDIVISNPPYISLEDFNNGETSRSVRMYEPRTALVPPHKQPAPYSTVDASGDLFYPRILEVAGSQGARLLVMEVGGLEQAKRVVKLAMEIRKCKRVEIWRDWVDGKSKAAEEEIEVEGRIVSIRGEGNGRVVACWMGE